MHAKFIYSAKISDKVIEYLKEQNFLSAEDLKDLENRAVVLKQSTFSVFLKENPSLVEKSAQLIAHLTGKAYLEKAGKAVLVKNEDFKPEKAEKHGALLVKEGDAEKIVCLDPWHAEFSKLQEKYHDKPVEVISAKLFDDLLSGVTATKSDISIVDAEDKEAANANSFVYNMLKKSIKDNASDIHLDLDLDKDGQAGFKLRNRVDGFCHDISFSNDIMLYRGIVNKLKLDAGLKIDERRLPQDGRISFELEGKVYNFRLSFMPNTIRNSQEEKIVLRQMADVKNCDLYKLGILDYDLKLLEEAISHPHGFVCVTGPTGSGKTTLLYSLLLQINRTTKNVITLEDPIEAEIPLVNQSQIFHRIGYDFASGLRVILRQDPDIVMVGEMRDEETASKAFEAANTGHLVFSTLHTNTAASSITRLLQMGVPFYFISSALKFVVAQRLVRKILPETAREHPDAKIILKEIEKAFKDASKEVREIYETAAQDPKILAPKENIDSTGYKGRMAILEVMKINDDIRHIINFENGNEDKIQEVAVKNGMMTLQQYGYLQVLKGLTTFEEINNTVRAH